MHSILLVTIILSSNFLSLLESSVVKTVPNFDVSQFIESVTLANREALQELKTLVIFSINAN